MSGICTWEQRVFTGSINTDYPLIGGHEAAGRIEAIGKDVHGDWEVGQYGIPVTSENNFRPSGTILKEKSAAPDAAN